MNTVTPYQIPGVKVLLAGAVGSGKTHSLRTLTDAGFEVFAIFTEPGMEVVADIPTSKLHWKYISPSTVSWEAMGDSAKKMNTLSFKSLTELPHINRGEHSEFLDVIGSLANFTCDRTGENFGPVDNLTATKKQVLWVDSLSGLNIMAMNLIAGSKPVKSPGDWGCAMDNLERLIQKLCTDLKCHVVLTAHLERETDELTGGSTLMISTLGRKLAPKIPRFFSDVIHVKRSEKAFTWSTVTTNADLKARNVAWAENLPPSFAPLLETWRKRTETAA